jgi:hypothetical protein
LKIRLRTRSAAESDDVVVNVSKVVKFSGRATVTNSELFLRQEILSAKTAIRVKARYERKLEYLHVRVSSIGS